MRAHLDLVFRRPVTEPKGLYRLFKIGVLIIFIGTLASALVGVRQNMWDFTSPPAFNTSTRCQAQEVSRKHRESVLDDKITVSKGRLENLHTALTVPTDPSYSEARSAITLEEKLKSSLESEKRTVEVETLSHYLPKLIIALVLSVLFAFAAATLASRQGIAALGKWNPNGKREHWQRVYWISVAIIFLAHVFREVFTSILQTENKSWFAWSSFCVSTTAWALMLVIAFGVAMVVAHPLTVLWHFGIRSVKPTKLDPDHTDGRWGVGAYLLFLQTWTLLSLVFMVFPIALWLRTVRNDPRISPAYLLTSLVLFTAGLVISGRMIRNAIDVRKAYQTQLKTAGNTWREIKAKDLPGDPTISFLGENWLKLPAVITGVFAFLWVILEQFGVSDFLIKLTGVK